MRDLLLSACSPASLNSIVRPFIFMLKNFFRSSKPNRDINSLLHSIADHKRAEDYSEFFQLLPSLQLFLPLTTPLPNDLPRGEQFQVEAGVEIKAQTVSIKGLECVLVFTSENNPNLGDDYAGIEGREVLQMVLKLPNIDGLVVQSSGTGWVGLDKQKISYVLSRQV